MTNRELKRAEARRRLNQMSSVYEPVDIRGNQNIPDGVTRVFQNNRFVVLVYDNEKDHEGRPAVMVRMRPNDGKPLLSSTFLHLQDCKNQLFGKEATGAMYLPPESKLVDAANMYWFYVVK